MTLLAIIAGMLLQGIWPYRPPAPISGGSGITLANVNAHGSKAASGATGITTDPIDMTNATFIIGGCATYQALGPSGMSDSLMNTWQPLTNYIGNNAQIQLFYVYSPTVSSTQTFTCAPNYAAVAVAGFKNTSGTTVDRATGATTATDQTTWQPGSVTPLHNNELVVTATGPEVGCTLTLPSDPSYTITDQIAEVGGSNFGIGLAYAVQTTAAATNPTWTGSTACMTVASVATFQ